MLFKRIILGFVFIGGMSFLAIPGAPGGGGTPSSTGDHLYFLCHGFGATLEAICIEELKLLNNAGFLNFLPSIDGDKWIGAFCDQYGYLPVASQCSLFLEKC